MGNKSYGHFCKRKRKTEYAYSLHSILFIATVMLSFSSIGSLCIVLFFNHVIDFIPARPTVERSTLLSLHTYQIRWRRHCFDEIYLMRQ